eukprot:1602337-Heterocapsa_arctica.AAC.1
MHALRECCGGCRARVDAGLALMPAVPGHPGAPAPCSRERGSHGSPPASGSHDIQQVPESTHLPASPAMGEPLGPCPSP